MTEVKRKRRRAAPAGIAPSEPERDILDQYLYEVSTYPLLKAAEEGLRGSVLKAMQVNEEVTYLRERIEQLSLKQIDIPEQELADLKARL